MSKKRVIYFLKIILTKAGLKPIISFILRSSLIKNYLNPTLIFFRNLPLRLKYYQLIRINKIVPTKHLIALNIIQKLCEIYKPFGIKFFLVGGQLLGAVRQEAFAGRPQDIDLGLIDIHFDKFIKNIDLIQKNFKTGRFLNADKKKFKIMDPDFAIMQNHVDEWTNNKKSTFYRFEKTCFQFRLVDFIPWSNEYNLSDVLVDIKFFSLKSFKGNQYWINNPFESTDENELPKEHFDQNDLLELNTAKLYGLKFYTPKKYEKYLEGLFGKDWKTPILKKGSKHFVWKK